MSASPSRFSNNAFALGLFSFNCAGGLFRGKNQVWDASWEQSLAAARLADEAGLEFILPLDRWRGQRGYPIETDDEGGSYESLVWGSAILAQTRRITVFGTINVRFANPVFISKQIVTAHHVGQGRFGVNIVSGSEARDNAMMGVAYDDHDARYDYSEEFVTILKRTWTAAEPFDYDGSYFNLRNVLAKPKPYGGRSPMLISAGASIRGRAFAVQHADALFTAISNFETLEAELRAVRAQTPERIPVFASGHLVSRPTRKEADEYYHYLVHELGDWRGVDEVMQHRMRNRSVPYHSMEQLKASAVSGNGTFAVRGSYDDVAQQFHDLNRMGLDGMAIALVDYVADFPWLRDEVLPRMERMNLRVAA